MCDTTAVETSDLIEVDLGPRAREFFTTHGLRARPVPAAGGGAQDLGARRGEGAAYDGRDLALHVGDDSQRAHCHRRRLEELLGLDQGCHLAWMNQVHSAVVATTQAGDIPATDTLVLDSRAGRASAGCCIFVADCVPVLLAFRDRALTAAVHASRRGIFDDVAPATIDFLRCSGVGPVDLWAATGSSICGSCYEVPEEMLTLSAQCGLACASRTPWETPGLDIAAGVLTQFECAGVGYIGADQWCTYEDPRFFSYRRDGVAGCLADIEVPR